MAGILLRKVRKSFGALTVVHDIDLDIGDKEFIILVGPSGCGKSTTLRMIAGLEEATSGELIIGDTIVNDVPSKDRDIAMVFQNYALYPHMTVFENIRCSLLWPQGYKYSFWRLVHKQRSLNEEAEKTLEQINLGARRDIPAGLLSYAEQRALVLVHQPPAMLDHVGHQQHVGAVVVELEPVGDMLAQHRGREGAE